MLMLKLLNILQYFHFKFIIISHLLVEVLRWFPNYKIFFFNSDFDFFFGLKHIQFLKINFRKCTMVEK